MGTIDDWRRVTAEAIADAASDGLAALELRFSPGVRAYAFTFG